MDARTQRGIEIAATVKLVHEGSDWIVPSQTGKGTYRVDPAMQSCTCLNHTEGSVKCKHLYAVEFTMKREMAPDGTVTQTETVKVTYAQDWHRYNLAQQNEKDRFAVLLRDLCETIPQPPQVTGRARLPLSDMLFATTFKVYSGFSSSRFTSDIRAVKDAGLVAHAPHFNSVSNYLAAPELTPLLKALVEASASPLKVVELDFAVDSTGFATTTYDRWFDHKWGKMKSRQTWIKTYLMTGVKTNIVTAVEATPTESADAPQLPALLGRTAETFDVREVSADKAYASKVNLRAIESIGATPYVPFQDRYTGSIQPNKTRFDNVWYHAWHFYHYNREAFLEHYHKRSNVETTMSMIKSKFGGSVKSKSPVAQVNEVLCKVLAHNICVLISSFYELGIESTFCAGMPVAQNVG